MAAIPMDCDSTQSYAYVYFSDTVTTVSYHTIVMVDSNWLWPKLDSKEYKIAQNAIRTRESWEFSQLRHQKECRNRRNFVAIPKRCRNRTFSIVTGAQKRRDRLTRLKA